ncbi:heterokaryon incompatibility protein-domain-containing protein [Xylaria arbuscula]|nr:heterokaryon incompatibility protein-domain-containing protein [Xylaria arbuscula]
MGRMAVRKRYRPPWKRRHTKGGRHPTDQTKCANSENCSCDSSQSSSSGEIHHEQPKIEAENCEVEPYSYAKLIGEDDIRILRLLPGRAGDPIQVQVQHVSMSIEQEYTAVSYAWGNRMALRTIFCEGKSIQVPMNLSRALTYMRHPSQHLYLWVDAICINQKDEVEKSRQVRRMRTIFMKAKKVKVWLGHDTRRSAKRVFRAMEVMTGEDFETAPPPEDLFWRDIERLFRKQWFSRLWCLQEVILAADADVQWGTEVAPWKKVAETATWIRSCPVQILRESAMKGANNANLMYVLGEDLKHNKMVSFLELLALSWQFKSSDRRDKVYGLLGIPTTDSDPGLGHVFVQPDYTKGDAEVYRRCASEIIQKTQSLRLLLHVQRAEDSDNSDESDQEYEGSKPLPSWVPRWNKYIHPMLAPSEQVASFNACATLPSSPPRVENDTLFAQGVRLSQVKSAARQNWGGLDTEDNSQSRVSDAWDMIVAESHAYKHNKEKLRAWCMVLTAGKDWCGELVDDTKQHLADMGAYMNNDDSRFIYDFNELPKIPGAEDGDGYRFELAFRNACEGRKFLLTDDGYVGLGPEIIEKEDLVCVLSGLVMPIILRPTDRGYRVIGEAYIHGIMFGEALGTSSTTSDFELEDFMLY